MERILDDVGQRSLSGQAADSAALKELNRVPSPSPPVLVLASDQPIQDHGSDSSPPPLSPHFPVNQYPKVEDYPRPRYFPYPYPSGSTSALHRSDRSVGGDDGLANHRGGRRRQDGRFATLLPLQYSVKVCLM